MPVPVSSGGAPERLFTVAEAAEVLHTAERFSRRLIAERRIRIPESVLDELPGQLNTESTDTVLVVGHWFYVGRGHLGDPSAFVTDAGQLRATSDRGVPR